MIHAVLNKDGVAVMGIDGLFVHLGGQSRVYRKPHSVRCRAAWAARCSTPSLKIEATELGFRVASRGEVYDLAYNLHGLDLLMMLLNREPEYAARKFSDRCSYVLSVAVRPR